MKNHAASLQDAHKTDALTLVQTETEINRSNHVFSAEKLCMNERGLLARNSPNLRRIRWGKARAVLQNSIYFRSSVRLDLKDPCAVLLRTCKAPAIRPANPSDGHPSLCISWVSSSFWKLACKIHVFPYIQRTERLLL
jgi:hypothetical protein